MRQTGRSSYVCYIVVSRRKVVMGYSCKRNKVIAFNMPALRSYRHGKSRDTFSISFSVILATLKPVRNKNGSLKLYYKMKIELDCLGFLFLVDLHMYPLCQLSCKAKACFDNNSLTPLARHIHRLLFFSQLHSNCLFFLWELTVKFDKNHSWRWNATKAAGQTRNVGSQLWNVSDLQPNIKHIQNSNLLFFVENKSWTLLFHQYSRVFSFHIIF